MLRLVTLVAYVIILLISLFGCGNIQTNEANNISTAVAVKEAEIVILKGDLARANSSINALRKEIDDYKQFGNRAIDIMDNTQIEALAKKEWKYHLSINDAQCPIDGNVTITSNYIRIILAEERTFYSLLPEEILLKGKLPGFYYNHMKVITDSPFIRDGLDGTVVTATFYQFERVKKGTIVKIQLTPELQKRLALKTNIVKIQVR